MSSVSLFSNHYFHAVHWSVQWVMSSLHAVHLVCWYSVSGVSPWQWALPSLSQPSWKKKQKRCAFTCPHWMKDLHSNTCTKMYKMYNIPVVASPDWGCSPPPELPACISLCRFLHPEFPRCPHEQPWGPTFPSPLVPPRPGRGGEKRNTKLVIFSHTQSAAFVRHSGRKTYRIFWKRSCTFGMLETMS